MDPTNKVKDSSPIPFLQQSTLPGLARGAELARQSLRLTTIIKRQVMLLIAGLVLVLVVELPISIVAILVGSGLIVNTATALLTVSSVRSIHAIGTQDDAESYRRLLITSERYELLRVAISGAANVLTVAFLLLRFSRELSSLVPDNVAFPPRSLGYFLLAFVVFNSFDFVVRLMRYDWIRDLRKSEDLAELDRQYQLISKKLELMRFIPGAGVATLILFLIDIPYSIALGFAGFLLVLGVLSAIELQRIKSVTFGGGAQDTSEVQPAVVEYPEEQIAGSVFGIMREATRVSILGVGKPRFAENSLLITNRRLLLIEVPVTGGNTIVGGVDYGLLNFSLNRAAIRRKGEELLRTLPVARILGFATADILYRDIATLALKQTRIKIRKIDGEELGFVFVDTEYIEPLKKLFRTYLKDRFLEA
jgi:hypothetical protein